MIYPLWAAWLGLCMISGLCFVKCYSCMLDRDFKTFLLWFGLNWVCGDVMNLIEAILR